MEAYQLVESNFQFGMIVASMVEAMAMQAENMQRQHRGESMAYTDKDFMNILERNGIDHNALVEYRRKML